MRAMGASVAAGRHCSTLPRAIMHHAPAPPSLHPFHRVVSGLASSIIEADEAETFAKREAKKKGNSESRVHDNNKAGGKMDEFMGDWS